MIWHIDNSFSESLRKESERMDHSYQFRLNTSTEFANSIFEASFLINDVIFRYGFEINKSLIVSEWLFSKNEREVTLFERNGNNFEINKTAFKEGIKFKENINENVLFLSYLAQNNQPISKIIWNWFQNVNHVSGIDDETYNNITKNLLRTDPDFKKWISAALKFLEISSVEASEQEGDIYTFHNKYDENNLLVGSEPFTLEEESAGTKKLVQLLGPLYDTLKHGKILFLDEFDSKLHPNLSRRLVSLFHHFNKRNSQFIFSAQDASLLDKKLFRRDQIWFIEKNQFGASSLYSLSDFNSSTVRSDSAFDKKYLENNFGAANTIEINDALMNHLYGSETK